jgi:hypothetical protein
MTYVPGYAADIFVSYSHSNDRDGWVTELKSKLASGLADLSEDVDVWFDADRLQTGDHFKQEIQEKLSNTRVLIALLSPAYLNSQFCMEEELDWFQNSFGREIIQYLKVPLAEDQIVPLPDAHFLTLHDREGSPLRSAALQEALNPEIWSIRSKLEAARKGCTHVYVAAAKLDRLRAHREELKRFLHQQEGLAVLPSEVVIGRTPSNRILKWLGDSQLSVHYDCPDDPLYLVQLQAAEAAGKPMLRVKPAQTAREIADQIRSHLQNLRRGRQIYLIYDPSTDGDQVAPLMSYYSRFPGCKVLEPQPGESYHRARLEESDAILFFHRNAPESWLDRHRESLLQGAALRKQARPEAWYFVRPGAPSEVRVTRDPQRPQWTITRTGDLNLTDLQPFSETFEKSRTASA